MIEPYVLGQHLVACSDRDIRTAEQWHDRIQGALQRARVAVLLVNQRFFGSDYICQYELPLLLADAPAGLLHLATVPIGHTDPDL